ncbi:MAG: FAD-binding oxidoreductase [Gammaproteobacteria bacterium]|nr:FAD-binding oxidoreductase [Gammaproteobacteria bacterium]
MIRERRPPARPSRVAARVREKVGPDAVRLEEGGVVAAPGGTGDASVLIGLAAAQGWRLAPAGAGLGPAGPAMRSADRPRPDLVLSSERMTGLLDHRPGDFNVAVGAGVTLDALASRLAPEGQWLALDPPGGGGVTVGGVVADGRAGPLGALFGRPRDLLLGLTVVDGAGRILRLGGRVVKNVAGFDLVRLVAGSRGGLGMITEATFRLHPLPAADLTLVWGCADALEAWELGRRLATLRVPVAAAEVVTGEWPEPLGAGPARLLLRLMGSAAASRQIVRLLEAEAGKPDEKWKGGASVARFRALSEGEGLGSGGGGAFRAHALPARGGELLSAFSGVACRRIALGLLGGTCRGYPSDGEAARAARVAAERIDASFAVPGDGWARVPAGSGRSPRTRLASRIVAGFDPSGILPGAWRKGRARSSGREG